MPKPRVALLRRLIEYRLPVEVTIAALSEYGWDCEAPLVKLQAIDIESVLLRYLAGELSSKQVTDWADLIECREDIDSGKSESVLSSAVFRLANPDLNAEVTQAVAREILESLREHG
jgi:hypothetical protein